MDGWFRVQHISSGIVFFSYGCPDLVGIWGLILRRKKKQFGVNLRPLLTPKFKKRKEMPDVMETVRMVLLLRW